MLKLKPLDTLQLLLWGKSCLKNIFAFSSSIGLSSASASHIRLQRLSRDDRVDDLDGLLVAFALHNRVMVAAHNVDVGRLGDL